MSDVKVIYQIFDTPDFQDKFWSWFDSLSRKEKNVFHYYKEDMAKLFFYNKYYRHKQVFQDEKSNYLTIRT